MRPALLFGEALAAIIGVKEDPDWQAAMRRRGIEDFDKVQIDPWPAGSFDSPHEDGRRISRCISYLRAEATDNGYAQPIEGVLAFFDFGARQGARGRRPRRRAHAPSTAALPARRGRHRSATT